MEDTNYVVVIDAIGPNHSVWLIHKDIQRDELGNEKVIRANEDKSLSPEVDLKFTAALMFENASDWLRLDGSSIDTRDLMAKIQETMIHTPITVGAADTELLNEALRAAKSS